jgi:hypothetical protein
VRHVQFEDDVVDDVAVRRHEDRSEESPRGVVVGDRDGRRVDEALGLVAGDVALGRHAIGRVENAIVLGLGERPGRAEEEPDAGEKQRSTQCSHEMPP